MIEANGRDRAKGAGVPRLELHIEVDGAEQVTADHLQVAGTVKPEGGQPVSFVGWVGLLALLQQAVSVAP